MSFLSPKYDKPSSQKKHGRLPKIYETDLRYLKKISSQSNQSIPGIYKILKKIPLEKVKNIDQLPTLDNISKEEKDYILQYVDYLKNDIDNEDIKFQSKGKHIDTQRKTTKLPEITKGGIKHKKNKTNKRRKTIRRRRL